MMERESRVEDFKDSLRLVELLYALAVHVFGEPGSGGQLAHRRLVGIHVVNDIPLWFSFSDLIFFILEDNTISSATASSGSSSDRLLNLAHVIGLEGKNDSTMLVTDSIEASDSLYS